VLEEIVQAAATEDEELLGVDAPVVVVAEKEVEPKSDDWSSDPLFTFLNEMLEQRS